MKYILYGFGGSYNHGGEAIIQTTCDMIRKVDSNATIILSTHFKEQDEEFALPVDHYCVRDREALQHEKDDGNQNRFTAKVYKEVIDEIDKDTIVLSVGGDNYCYDNWEKWTIIHQRAKEVGAKTILWSCSIEPDMIAEKMIAHLKTFDIIMPRESRTHEALLKAGLTNVKKCYDVAFVLEPRKIELPKGFESGNMVAINVSPLVLRREKFQGMIMQNIIQCIDYILTNTSYKVLLIPHVLMSADNDVDALLKIKDCYANDDRIVLFDRNCSASQYKYLISKCRFGIFARTHASIAAYSSMIPSIVLGYSIKSIGIASDLGMEKYVLPIEQLEDGSLLVSFREIVQEEQKVKGMLYEKHNEMIEGALKGKVVLQEINTR